MPAPTKVRKEDISKRAERDLMGMIQSLQDIKGFKELNWEGSFSDYLHIVEKNSKIARTSFQRIYDMIISYGTEEFTEYKKKITHFKFFDDPFEGGKDAVFGLDVHLMKLLKAFKAAARQYGTEKRILLLHGPVGSAKSTVVRLLKKGLEAYSRIPEGAIYSFSWLKKNLEDARSIFGTATEIKCPMHEEPLRLIPLELREKALGEINKHLSDDDKIILEGDLCPSCRYIYKELVNNYEGDWAKAMDHIKVRRIVLSEKDRIGIGTFQPKDEKNQDSTELTGDINYRKIAEYGSDSDPRAFNFDGEFNIANRGLIEFIEVLKLDVAFLYDLLGASQEHKIKPKKFAQTDIDEVIIGHSVAGDTIIPYVENENLCFDKIDALHEKDPSNIKVLALDLDTKLPTWTSIKAVFRHKFTGEMIKSTQKWGIVETTPNHSIYNREFKTFYPAAGEEMLALRKIELPLIKEKVNLKIDNAFIKDGYLFSEKLHKNDSSSNEVSFKAHYDVSDKEDLKPLLKLMAWYITEGHTRHSRRTDREISYTSGVIISSSNLDTLEELKQAAEKIYTGAVGIQKMELEKHGAHRLNISSHIAYQLFAAYCGEHSEGKHIPNFVFTLPKEFRKYFMDELIKGDGSRYVHPKIAEVATEEYLKESFQYTTTSPLLASQLSFLLATFGTDHSFKFWDRSDTGNKDVYYLRYVNPERRHERFTATTYTRQTANEWVYDIECDKHHNFVAGMGNIVCHNTNEAEFKRFQSNEYMEALRDRTVRIDLPYITKLHEEIKIYEKDYRQDRIRGKHIAPHTLEMAAMWAVLTRLEDPKKANLTLMQKLKLFDGKSLPGFTEDNVKELRKEATREGLDGISPRYIQDKISNALVGELGGGCVNPFMVLNELESGLRHHALLKGDEQRKRFAELLALVKEEYEDLVKNEVQRAISADEEAISRLCSNYIDHVKAYTQKERVKNKYTGQDEEPDERLMRSIEEKIDIPESRKDDFRREIMNYIGALAVEGKQFNYKMNERLHRALELKLFEDQKDSIKLTSLVSTVIDKDTQEKIDVVKSRLIKNYGYCEVCSTDVLNFVASIFARGDIKDRQQ
jgi:serine protein kinase